jgi:hypothetical protein
MPLKTSFFDPKCHSKYTTWNRSFRSRKIQNLRIWAKFEFET